MCNGHQIIALIGLQELNFLLVAVQQSLQVAGHVIKVQISIVAVSQHLGRAVLASDDDETATLDVEGIVIIGIGDGMGSFGMDELQVGHGGRP